MDLAIMEIDWDSDNTQAQALKLDYLYLISSSVTYQHETLSKPLDLSEPQFPGNKGHLPDSVPWRL